MQYHIRTSTDRDIPALLQLMQAHAQFEGQPFSLSDQHRQLNRLSQLPNTFFVVQSETKLVGYMSVIKQFSSWELSWYLYLDCLYLSEEARGAGIGQQLMLTLKAFAREHALTQVQWQTPIDNKAAIGFYQSFGTVNKAKQRFFWQL